MSRLLEVRTDGGNETIVAVDFTGGPVGRVLTHAIVEVCGASHRIFESAALVDAKFQDGLEGVARSLAGELADGTPPVAVVGNCSTAALALLLRDEIEQRSGRSIAGILVNPFVIDEAGIVSSYRRLERQARLPECSVEEVGASLSSDGPASALAGSLASRIDTLHQVGLEVLEELKLRYRAWFEFLVATKEARPASSATEISLIAASADFRLEALAPSASVERSVEVHGELTVDALADAVRTVLLDEA